jgi:hypothetical protein
MRPRVCGRNRETRPVPFLGAPLFVLGLGEKNGPGVGEGAVLAAPGARKMHMSPQA